MRETEKIDQSGREVLPEAGYQYPQSSAYVSELAWADCENRQINIVKSTRINDKKYNFVNPEKYIDNFEDLRSRKIIKTYSVEGGGDIIPLNIDSTSRIDKPWREMLTKVCGELSQGQEYNHNLPTINNWLMPDGVYANIRVDVNTLISNGSKRKFWFYVSNDNNQSDNVSPYEKTPAGVEPVLRDRASRIEVDCENKTYKMIIDRTSRLSSDWHLGSEVKPIEPKTLVYSMVFASGANPICGN